MPYCPKCGNLVDENMTFCPRCGAPLKSQAATQTSPPSTTYGKNEKSEKTKKTSTTKKMRNKKKANMGSSVFSSAA
jgi:DNA-directed RNA polymerase subunit M/transcription elongation factor TFIIS